MTDRLASFLDAINTELRPGAATIAGYDPETLVVAATKAGRGDDPESSPPAASGSADEADT